MTTFKLEIQGTEAEFEVLRQGNTFRVTQNDTPYDLRLLNQEGFLFVLELKDPNGKRRLIRAAGQSGGDKRQLWANGRTFSYSRIRPRGSKITHHGSLSSSIPAVVSKLLVQTGDEVNEGDKLILLESMKMVIPILANQGGKIRAIHCSEGESVQAGHPLIEIEQQND